jgi:hypothetical protein
MHKLIGVLFVSILLFEGPAFSQSIIPSKAQPINPTVTE